MRKYTPPMVGLLLGVLLVGLVVRAQDAPAPTGPGTFMAAEAAAETGIRGTVKAAEAGNPALPNAAIAWSGPDNTSGTATTTSTGEFDILNVPQGTYVLNISANNYSTRSNQTVTVISGAVTPTEIKLRQRETVLTAFRKLGVVGWPQLLGSVGALTFIIERLLAYGRLNSGRNELLTRVNDSLGQRNVSEAIQACEDRGTPLANVLKAGLLRYSHATVQGRTPVKADLHESMQEAALLEMPEYERNLQWLSTIGVVMPLLGLTGTVTGMIKSFTVIALEGTNDPNALAGGIAEALYTTAFGLFVAAPTIVFYAFFENTVNRASIQIEIAATDTANALTEQA